MKKALWEEERRMQGIQKEEKIKGAGRAGEKGGEESGAGGGKVL